MGNLIKMDFRRMVRSVLLMVSLIVIAGLNILVAVVVPIVMKLVPNTPNPDPALLSDIIANPFSISLLMILLFMSVVSFFYADFSGGFIKNLAGQVGSRSRLVVSKFVVVGIHNLIFLLAGVLSRVIGALIGTAVGAEFTIDGLVPAALATFLIKWMLSMGISAILLFVAVGIRSKTFASIIGVIIGTGALGLVYFGLSSALGSLFKTDVSISDFMPDQLINSVSVGSNVAVVNAIVVALICTAVFLTLAVKVFNKRDIK